MKALVLALVILFAAVAAMWLTGGNVLPEHMDKHVEPRASATTLARGSLGTDAVLAIAPGRVAGSSAASIVKPMPASLQEFYKARSYAPLYARLKDSTTRTPEESWMLAEILKRCGRIAEDSAPRWRRSVTPGARDRFAAALAPNDPDRDRRIAAFEAINYDVCSDVGEIATKRAEIRALIEAGAAGGDPKARAALVEAQLEDDSRGPDGKPKPGSIPRISDAQVETLRQVIASGDPLAMRSAASMLMGQYGNMSLRDADDRAIDPFAFYRASVLLSCDYGLPCGPDAQWIANSCANLGQCGANSLRDHMMYYQSSPASSQVMASYEAALRAAARDGNWSFFHFYPGPSPSTAASQAPGNP